MSSLGVTLERSIRSFSSRKSAAYVVPAPCGTFVPVGVNASDKQSCAAARAALQHPLCDWITISRFPVLANKIRPGLVYALEDTIGRPCGPIGFMESATDEAVYPHMCLGPAARTSGCGIMAPSIVGSTLTSSSVAVSSLEAGSSRLHFLSRDEAIQHGVRLVLSTIGVLASNRISRVFWKTLAMMCKNEDG